MRTEMNISVILLSTIEWRKQTKSNPAGLLLESKERVNFENP